MPDDSIVTDISNINTTISVADVIALFDEMRGRAGTEASVVAWTKWDALQRSTDPAVIAAIAEASRQLAVTEAAQRRDSGWA